MIQLDAINVEQETRPPQGDQYSYSKSWAITAMDKVGWVCNKLGRAILILDFGLRIPDCVYVNGLVMLMSKVEQ